MITISQGVGPTPLMQTVLQVLWSSHLVQLGSCCILFVPVPQLPYIFFVSFYSQLDRVAYHLGQRFAQLSSKYLPSLFNIFVSHIDVKHIVPIY